MPKASVFHGQPIIFSGFVVLAGFFKYYANVAVSGPFRLIVVVAAEREHVEIAFKHFLRIAVVLLHFPYIIVGNNGY